MPLHQGWLVKDHRFRTPVTPAGWPRKLMQNCRMRSLLFFVVWGVSCPLWAAHGYALWGDLKYAAGFSHFEYVNPEAPKRGELRLVSNLRVSTFDKYNPFTIKGSAPAYLANLMFDSLLTGSLDETGSGYGLLASDVDLAADGLSATYQIRPQARFHNGDPVLALDVKHSFDTLMGPYTSPSYKTLLQDVAGVEVVDARTVRSPHGGRFAGL
jgi:microcin C transport system substrate-binding protein